MPVMDRILAKVELLDNGCWEWTAGRGSHGYGMIWLDGQMRVAHRVVHEQLIGPIPAEYEVDHLCRNRGCVNPAHLEAVTRRENCRRSDSPSAINARKTECHQGHPFTPENTRIQYDNRHQERPARHCRTCDKETNDRRYR